MPYAVFPVRTWYVLGHTMRKAVLTQNLGDMHEQRLSKNQSYGPRADGRGNLTTYKGQNVFNVNIRNMNHINASTTAVFDVFWKFYTDHGDGDAFYYYNPAENTGDPGTSPLSLGIDQIGRYLVRFQNTELNAELFRRFLYNTTLTLVEVRS